MGSTACSGILYSESEGPLGYLKVSFVLRSKILYIWCGISHTIRVLQKRIIGSCQAEFIQRALFDSTVLLQKGDSNDISVLVGFEKEVPVQYHQRYCTDSPSVHHGSAGILAAARIRRESFTWNHSSLVLLRVSLGCGWTHAKDIWHCTLVKWVFDKASISRRFLWWLFTISKFHGSFRRLQFFYSISIKANLGHKRCCLEFLREI